MCNSKSMILYINTQDPKVVTVALKKNEEVVKSFSQESKYGSQILLPLIVKLIPPQKWDLLEGIEVEKGPGSFTGLRVGASIAQALGFALNIPVNGEVGKPVNLKYT